jgi:hypothetical protein
MRVSGFFMIGKVFIWLSAVMNWINAKVICWLISPWEKAQEDLFLSP